MGEIATAATPTGVASAFGRAISADSGTTWSIFDNQSNFKMLIQGTALAVAPQLVITAAERIGNDLRLSFTSTAGRNYVIQSRADLVSGDWTNLPGTNLGNGGIVQTTLTNALLAPQQFYRVRVLP